MSQKNINLTFKFFIEIYNNVSNDIYLFGVDKLFRSQMQVCVLVFLDVYIVFIFIYLDKWGYFAVFREIEVMVLLSGEWFYLVWMCFRVVQVLVLFQLFF